LEIGRSKIPAFPPKASSQGHLGVVLRDLLNWMEEHEYESIRQMCGSMSQRNAPNPAAFQRSNYARVLSSYSLPRNL
jgi:dihydroorotate dehydrogenase (fumarate)